MATRIINKNANLWASPKAKLSVPFDATWEGFFSFGVDAATSARNLIEGGVALAIIGSPVYGANYIELTGAQVAYLVTSIKNSTDMTIVATVKPLEEKGIAVVTNYQSQREDATRLCVGTSLAFDVGSNSTDGNVISRFNHAVLVSGVSTGAAAETSAASPIGSWYMISGRVKNSDRTRRVDNLTAGTSGVNLPVVNPVDLGDVFRLGSAYNSQFPGKCQLCEVAIISEYISDADFSTLTRLMRASAARKGITV